MNAAKDAVERRGFQPVLKALALCRATFYRQQANSDRVQQSAGGASAGRPSSRALSDDERGAVLGVLYSERFMDTTPTEVYATLLDEGTYVASVRTMYRLLKADGADTPRTRQKRHGHYQKPELLATRPNQLWSWDITRLKGPRPWTYFYLYVILDVFSRYVVGFMVACQENQGLAKELIEQTILKQDIEPGQLTIHADRGSPMKSKSVALLLSDLGVLKTHSRPHVSNDNPYSEAQFKTLKYRPDFPDRFASIEEARQTCGQLIDWYNNEHRHAGIALCTPADLHYGRAEQIIQRRQGCLDAAYQAHPERFVNRPPRHPGLPEAAWINAPCQNGSLESPALPGYPRAGDLSSRTQAATTRAHTHQEDCAQRKTLAAPLNSGRQTQEIIQPPVPILALAGP
jgi:putative transposase